jgi:hypothetical protein
MQTVWKGRLTQAAAKYGEVAPNAAVCCNACRTCVQTNLLGLAVAAVAGAGIAVARVARRLTGSRSTARNGQPLG